MPVLNINKFLGLFTRAGRDSRPQGALDDVSNLVFNVKTFKPSLRTGYNADLTAAPTDISGGTVLSSFRYPRGTHPATEVPTAQDIVILAGTDGSSGKHFFQRPFWKNNAGTLENSEWLRWGENTTTTISGGVGGPNFNLTAGSATNDYYNGWIVHNTTRSEYGYIIDYVGSTKSITLMETIPSDWQAGDTVILYRHFHDNPTFAPSWTDPIVLKQGNNILVSGGQGSTVGYKPIWSGYINKTFFSGASTTFAYQQTYVSEAEIKTGGLTLGNPSGVASGTDTLDADTTWHIGYILETDDGQRSNLLSPSTAYVYLATSPVGYIRSVLRVAPAQINKRGSKIHVFAGKLSGNTSATLEWDQYFFIKTLDLLTGTGWTYTGPGAAPGDYSRNVDVTGPEWTQRGEDLVTFLGHSKPNRSTVSFSHGVISNGRLYVAKYYDYNAALNYNDQINFSPVAGNGVSQYNKLLDLDDATQSTIEAGDPSVIKGLAAWEGKLFIPKDRGIFWIDITYDPAQWILQTVTREIGCDAPDSIVATPNGIVWAKSADGVYLWRAGDPIEITRNWRDTFRALTTTYASQWIGYYDSYYRSYRLMYTADGSDKTTVYEASLDAQDPDLFGLPLWTKHTLAANLGHVFIRANGDIYFSNDASRTFVFSSTATQEVSNAGALGQAIKPYLKLGEYVLSESDLLMVLRWGMNVAQGGATTGQLDLKVYVDGSSVGSFTGLTKTASRFASALPIVGRLGQRFDFEFNSNATRADLGTSYRIENIDIEYEIVPRGGDKQQSL